MILALIIILTRVAFAHEPSFAPLGLSSDAESVLTAHFDAWFGGAAPSSEDGCTRGEAAPWLERGAAKGGYAYRQRSPIAAVETVAGKDGANITIVHDGCESYAAVIRFAFPAPDSDARDAAGRYAADALREIRLLGAKSVFDLALAERELRRRPNMAIGEEVPVAGDGEEFLQTRIMLKRVEVLEGGEVAVVEFVLVKGPL